MACKNLSKTVKKQINTKLSKMNPYHVIIPQGQIQSILESHGVTIIDNLGYKFHGPLFGPVGSTMLHLGLTKTKKRDKTYRRAATCLMLSWNCLASGSYEIISYIS